MKTTIVLGALFFVAVLAGCSKPKTESAPNQAAWANQNPRGRVRSIAELENVNPATGEIDAPKEQNGQK